MDNDIKNKRKGYMTISQKQRLVELMTDEHELRSGKFSSKFTKKIADAKWKDISNNLNSIPGGHKNAQEWKRAWADLKTKTKSKLFQIKKYANKTGGGPSCSMHLNEIDDQILALINPTTLLTLVLNSKKVYIYIESDEIVLDNRNIVPIQQVEDQVEDINLSLSILFDQGKEPDLENTSEAPDISINKINKISSSESNSKKLKYRSNALMRLQKSVTATEQLADIGRKKLLIKKGYYNKKLVLLEKQTELLSRQVLSHEKQTSVLEQIQTDLKNIATMLSI